MKFFKIKKTFVFFVMASSLLFISATDGKQKESIIAKNAKLQKEATGFSFTEGPAVDKNGRIFFTDQPNDKIFIWEEKKEVSSYLEGTGRSNGLFFNTENQLVACADEFNQLVYFDKNKEKNVIQEGFEGKHLNAPNDLWISPNEGIYFSDPYYPRTWWSKNHQMEQEVQGVFYVSPDGNMIRVIADFERPNGLIGTPDGKTLYVADIKAEKIWKYNIETDGTLTNKTFFAPHGSDGMTIDHQGNVYLTSEKVWVYNPDGELIEEIEVPEKPSNVCFGGKKRNTLFITARTSIYTIKMKVKGVN